MRKLDMQDKKSILKVILAIAIALSITIFFYWLRMWEGGWLAS
ncbi:MAG: hypothetical protein ACFFER_14355 [Candidatus Thorarchaeota archaeon]